MARPFSCLDNGLVDEYLTWLSDPTRTFAILQLPGDFAGTLVDVPYAMNYTIVPYDNSVRLPRPASHPPRCTGAWPQLGNASNGHTVGLRAPPALASPCACGQTPCRPPRCTSRRPTSFFRPT